MKSIEVNKISKSSVSKDEPFQEQLVALRIVYRLSQKGSVRYPLKAQTMLCGLPAQERCWPTICAHLIGHEYVAQ